MTDALSQSMEFVWFLVYCVFPSLVVGLIVGFMTVDFGGSPGQHTLPRRMLIMLPVPASFLLAYAGWFFLGAMVTYAFEQLRLGMRLLPPLDRWVPLEIWLPQMLILRGFQSACITGREAVCGIANELMA